MKKSRTYLRLESLFSQIRDNLESDQSWAHIAFFKGCSVAGVAGAW